MVVSFNLNNANFPLLTNSNISKSVSSISPFIPFTIASRFSSAKVRFLANATDKPLPRATCFFPGNVVPKYLHNPSQSVFDLAHNIPTSLKHHFTCKSVMSFECITANVNCVNRYHCQALVYHCKPYCSCNCLCYKLCQFSTTYLQSVSFCALYSMYPFTFFLSER